ncbi:MAG: hypothetical protein PHX70_00765 [Clostridium sp.]|nr:hypothetical protein [Clostridium sp.]
MGDILLNSGELSQCASQVQQLISEVLNMQNEVKSTVNELDSNNAGRSARYASNVMYSCYGKGQKVNAGLVEIKQIVSEAIRRFAELDRDTAGSMVKICTDPEHARAFFNKEQSKIKKEINSDFVEYKKEAKSTEKQTFKREEPKTLWDDIKGVGKSIKKFFANPKVQAILTVAGGILTVAVGGLPAIVIGSILLAHGLSDCWENFASKSGFNPLRDVGYRAIISFKEHKNFSDKSLNVDVGNWYGGVESGLSFTAMFTSPNGVVAALKNVKNIPQTISSAKNIFSDGITAEKVLNRVKSTVKLGSDYYWKNIAGDIKVNETWTGMKELAKANYKSIVTEVKDTAGYIYDEAENGNKIKDALKFGYDYLEVSRRSDEVARVIRPLSLGSDLAGWNPTKKYFTQPEPASN